MAYDYLNKTGLTKLWTKIKDKFVVKEHKTGSDSEYKVLSDNNLTDALVEKIMSAGDSSFDGQYTSLTGKPQIEGHELVSGNNTAESLGLATPADITEATTDMATQTWVQGQGYATTSNVNSLISAAVAGAYKAKGSVAFASLPALASATIGDVYNVTDQFSTTADFMEGTGKTYSAGTNVVCVDAGSGTKKWDVLAGFVDLAGYVAKTDMVAITDGEIDEICV